MSLYKQKFNPISRQLNLVPISLYGISIKSPVPNEASLPLTGNTINDGCITSDTGYLYIWDGASWINQGDVIDVSWGSITGDINTQLDLKSALNSKQNNLIFDNDYKTYLI